MNMFHRALYQWRGLSNAKKTVIIGGPPLLIASINSYLTSQSVTQSINEMREFPLNSASAQLVEALDTGDVVVFSRRFDGRIPRSLLLVLSKYVSGRFDQCGVIVRDTESMGSTPRVFEWSWTGPKLTALDQRILHSNSSEIIIRKLECQSDQPKDESINQFVEQIMEANPTSISHIARRVFNQAVDGLIYHAAGGERGELVAQCGSINQFKQSIEAVNQKINSLPANDPQRTRLISTRQTTHKQYQRTARQIGKHSSRLIHQLTAQPISQPNAIQSISQSINKSPSPSAALTAAVLIRIGALESSIIEPSIQTTGDQTNKQNDQSASTTPSINPPTSYSIPLNWYLPKHFLSFSHLALTPNTDFIAEFYVKSDKPLAYSKVE